MEPLSLYVYKSMIPLLHISFLIEHFNADKSYAMVWSYSASSGLYHFVDM